MTGNGDGLRARRLQELLVDIYSALARSELPRVTCRASFLQAVEACDRVLSDLHEFRERQIWIDMHFKRGMCAKAALDSQIFESKGREYEKLRAIAEQSFDRVVAYLDAELYARKFSRSQFARAEIISDSGHDVRSNRDSDLALEALEQSIILPSSDQQSVEQAISWGRIADLLRNRVTSGDPRYDLNRSVSAYRQAIRILSHRSPESRTNKAVLKCYVQNLAHTEAVLESLNSEYRNII